MSLFEFSKNEHQLLLDAEEKYGNAFTNAYNSTIMLSNVVEWPVIDCDMFLRFYSQMKKYHSLSVLSLVRQHRVQSKMNLRYFLESTAHAAFSIAHVGTDIYQDFESMKFRDPQGASKKVYAWIGAKYPGYSDFIKDLKGVINEQTAHPHIANSAHNFDLIRGEHERTEIVTSFFDFEDHELVKTDLWLCAKAGLTAVDLLLTAQRDFGVFLPKVSNDDLAALMADNDDVLVELRVPVDVLQL